jgi:hypothetical protein
MKRIVVSLLAGIVLSTTLLQAQPVTVAKMPTGKKFIIQSGMNYGRNKGGCFDIPGDPAAITNGLNIQVWNLENSNGDRLYTLLETSQPGLYSIQIADNANMVVSVDGSSAVHNASNVGAWENYGGQNQKFFFEHLGNGRFKIYGENNHIITLDKRSSDNGSNVYMWGNHEGAFVEWYLLDAATQKPLIPTEVVSRTAVPVKGTAVIEGKKFLIQSANEYGRSSLGYFDLPGVNPNPAQRMEVKVYQYDAGKDRLYRFEKEFDSEYYQIFVANTYDGVIDSKDGNKINNGSRVIVNIKNNDLSQKFYLKHLGNGRFKIYNAMGRLLTLENRKSDNDTNVSFWDDHDGIWTEWFLIDPETKQAYIPAN